ncbi:Hypothetical predicted protein [Mytilus galloprovincialis]|uniref:Uncharacterized protein n=1 Tax=Mytilus galloprovincialis TaxID=29158 RepID=A0A8B6EDF1_MYTGA|nr:Hypothetical predicted protein [Mytilus galloprovincialis]
MATNTDESGSCKINTTQSGSATDLSEQTNIKQISTLIDSNNKKDLASHNDTVSKDKSGQVHETNDISQSDMNVAHFQPDQMFSRMEASFTLALDKILSQQSDLFNSKFQLMEHYYNQSIETNNNNFKMLQDTITTILKPTSDNDKLAARIVSLEKENIILKSSVNEFKNTSAINIECWKSKIETQKSQMELQKNSQDTRIKDLQSDISDLQTKLNNKISKIEEMASAYNSVSENLKHKEDEVLSLKLHLSQDNTNDFQEVKLKHPKTRNTKHVVLIGTSNIKGIDPNKLSSKYSAEKHEAFTLEQTDHVIQELEVTPDILVLHSLSNAVRSTPNEKSIEYLHTIIDSAKEKFNDTKIVISLPTPRADEESLNNKAQILSLMAKEDLRNEPNVEICDNSNMAFKGSALQKYLDPKDNYHLSLNGTKMLASNIRDTIDRILGLPPRTLMKRNVNQYNYTPPRVQRDNTNDFVPDDDSQQYMYNRGRGQRYRGGRGNNHQFRGNRGYHRRGY